MRLSKDLPVEELIRLRPLPRHDEAFSSWTQRVATSNGLPLKDFIQALRGRYSEYLRPDFRVTKAHLFNIDAERVEHDQCIVLMALATGLPLASVQRLTMLAKTHYYSSFFLTPIGPSGGRMNQGPTKATLWYADSYCPDCLTEHFSLRRAWRPGFPCVCPAHKTVLMDECPSCLAVLKFYDKQVYRHTYGRTINRLHCWDCGFDLAQAPRRFVTPAYQDMVTLLQTIFEERPRVGPSDWRNRVLHVFHWQMDAFLQTCTSLPVASSWQAKGRFNRGRLPYLYQSCRVRYALFEAACKTLGRVRRKGALATEDDHRCREWMGKLHWSICATVGLNLQRIIHGLDNQVSSGVPDRTVLPIS